VSTPSAARKRSWITRGVLGIVLATFFSDFSHEMATAILPLYLGSVGLGPAALGMIEGVADFVVSLSKLLGGVAGHHLRHKRPLASLGYLVTTLGTAGLGLTSSIAALVSLRGVAWFGRGFRSPLRDHLLADAVERTHYGRAYGLERAGDMLGAVAGPLVATLLIWLALDFRTVMLWSLVPGLVAAGSMFFLTRGVERDGRADGSAPASDVRPAFPRVFWLFLGGVFLFGMGDFSRTFLIWFAARGLGESGNDAGGALSLAVLLYALHNLVAAGSAYPVGRLGDRGSKLRVLVSGYGLGVVTNLLLALTGAGLGWLVTAIVLSGLYISVEETLEKATAAEFLPRELRSLGFGYLACANAVGDMVSSLYVGFLSEHGHQRLAFCLAAGFGAAGVAWILVLQSRARSRGPRATV
jgi:MFS family permease